MDGKSYEFAAYCPNCRSTSISTKAYSPDDLCGRCDGDHHMLPVTEASRITSIVSLTTLGRGI